MSFGLEHMASKIFGPSQLLDPNNINWISHVCTFKQLHLGGNLEQSHHSILGMTNQVKYCPKFHSSDATKIILIHKAHM